MSLPSDSRRLSSRWRRTSRRSHPLMLSGPSWCTADLLASLSWSCQTRWRCTFFSSFRKPPRKRQTLQLALEWAVTALSSFLQKMLQCPYYFFDVLYIHNGMEDKEDETSWKVRGPYSAGFLETDHWSCIWTHMPCKESDSFGSTSSVLSILLVAAL